MIYVETSVVLAQVLAEDRPPPEGLWTATPISSRLTEYEVWTRVHARGLGASHGELGSSAESVGRFGLRELTQRMVQGDF
jgi:hypothetical protein